MNSFFKRQETYQEAVDKTEDGLMPIAVKLKIIEDERDYIPDPTYTEESKFIYGHPPCACLVMSTVFSDEEYNGKWGHCFISEEARQIVARFVMEEAGQEIWAFLSQHWTED